MNKSIWAIAIGAAFVAGMFVSALPADATHFRGGNASWVKLGNSFDATLNQLQAINKHFVGPNDDNTPTDPLTKEQAAELGETLRQIRQQAQQIDQNGEFWFENLEPGR